MSAPGEGQREALDRLVNEVERDAGRLWGEWAGSPEARARLRDHIVANAIRLRAASERGATELDNHHNALRCPYCTANLDKLVRERAERGAAGEQRIEGAACRHPGNEDDRGWAFWPHPPHPDADDEFPASLLIHNAGASVPEPAEER